MAITMTKINGRRFIAPGHTGQEYSVTFDTNYPATGGESLALGSTTNFPTDVLTMIVTKQFANTDLAFVPVLIPSTAAGSACVKLYVLLSSTTNTSKAALLEVSTTTDISAVKGRFILEGY